MDKLRSIGLKGMGYKLLVVVVLAVSAVFLGNLVQNQTPANVYATGNTVSFSILPSTLTLPGSGSTQLVINPSSDKISAVYVEIDFDTSMVHLANEVVVGSALPTVLPGNTTMAQANSSGKIIIHLGITPGNSTFPTAVFSLATLTWSSATSISNQTTPVSINTATTTAVDDSDPSNPQYVPVTASSLTVSLNPVASPTPAPSPTSTPTPRPTHTPTPIPTPTLIPTLIPTHTPTPAPTSVPSPTTIPTLIPTAVPTPTPKINSETQTFTAVEDKTISYNNRDRDRRDDRDNTHTNTLTVDASPVSNFLLKFKVSGLNRHSVSSAMLRVYCTDSSFSGGKFYSTTNNWSEGNLTWSNAPKAFDLLGSLRWVLPRRWYQVNVSKFVIGEGTYSFRVTSSSFDGASYSSLEGSHPPQLVVSY